MRRTQAFFVVLAVLALVAWTAPVVAQQSSGEGYDIEVYEVTSGQNSFTGVNGGQVTVRVRFTTNSSSSGTCGSTSVVPNSCGAFGFQLNWDPAVLSYNSHTQLSGVPSGWFANIDTSNTASGQIGMGAFGTSAATSPADVLEVVFDVVGGAGSTSSLTFSNLTFGDTGGNDLCGTFNAPGNGSTGTGDYYDEEYDGTVTVVSYGVTVNPTTLNLTEGNTGTFDVVLNTQPTADVTIALTSTDTARATVSPASMTFTTANWNTAQTATVTAVDDQIDNGDVTVTIQTDATSTDPNYNGIAVDDVTVNVTDNDTRGITVNPATLSMAEGGSGTFSVVLDTEPTATVTVSVTSSDTGQATVSPASLTFTTTNWATAQNVTVDGVDDAVADGDWTGTVDLAGSGGDYGSETAQVQVTVTDNDSPGVTVNPTTVSVTEGGATATYDVVLNTLPTADVTVAIATGGQTTVNPTSLTFTSSNGTTAQTVTVTAVDDAVFEGPHTDTITHTVTSADPDYNNATASDVTVNITDNESAYAIADSDGDALDSGNFSVDVAEEGETSDTFTVALAGQPQSDVTVTVTPDANVTVSPATLTFTNANWNTAQTVTVTAVDDTTYEGGTGHIYPANVNLAASSADATFDGATEDVPINVEDNDKAPAVPVLGGAGLVLLIGLLTAIGVAVLRRR